jgi:hypothetical protein
VKAHAKQDGDPLLAFSALLAGTSLLVTLALTVATLV